jgi:hypothetical protein
MSLLLLLHAIGETAKIEAKFDRQTFSDLTYYDRVVTGEERLESATINIPASLRDAAERWRVFHFHGYLTVALQSFLVCSVGVLRHHPGGIDRSRLLAEFSVPALGARFRKLFETPLPGSFFDLTPAQLLGVPASASPMLWPAVPAPLAISPLAPSSAKEVSPTI